jgi:hypothetical protein
MNQGYVSKQNMGGSEKQFGGAKATYKKLPSEEGEKQFKHPGTGDKGVTDRNHGGVKAPKFKN